MNKWYLGAGSDSDIAISTRIRLARNLDGFVFPRRIDDKSAQDVENIVKEALAGEKAFDKSAVCVGRIGTLCYL